MRERIKNESYTMGGFAVICIIISNNLVIAKEASKALFDIVWRSGVVLGVLCGMSGTDANKRTSR